MTHRHALSTEAYRSYTGTAAGAEAENRAAHGGICVVARCACGATRETNSTGWHVEVGTWQEPDDTDSAHD